MVLISKADKRKVYLYLLSEGVIVFKKDRSMKIHTETVNLIKCEFFKKIKKYKNRVSLTYIYG